MTPPTCTSSHYMTSYKHFHSPVERHAPIDNGLHMPMTNHTLGKMHRPFLTEAPESVGRVWRKPILFHIIPIPKAAPEGMEGLEAHPF